MREEVKKSKKQKSGVHRIAGEICDNPFDWPQEKIYRDGVYAPKWNELNKDELPLGLLRMADEAKEDGRMDEYYGIMALHRGVLEDIADYPFPAVLWSVHYTLRQIEQRRQSWARPKEFEYKRDS